MEEKKYEAGRVEISSAEYRDLIKDAVEAQKDASDARSRMWEARSERDKLAKEIEEANKKIAELEGTIRNLQGTPIYNTPVTNPPEWWKQVTCTTLTNNTEGK